MKYFDFLLQIQTQLQELNDCRHDLLVTDFLVPSKGQNSMIVKEGGDGAEVLVCLEERILKKFQNAQMPRDFRWDHLPDLSVVVEELSHFNTFCHKVSGDLSISQIELEVQAEVDKFALALEWLEMRNEFEFVHHVFDTLFEKCELGAWVQTDEERQRYHEAHELARSFCRRILAEKGSREERQRAFKEFYGLNHEQKLSLPTKN